MYYPLARDKMLVSPLGRKVSLGERQPMSTTSIYSSLLLHISVSLDSLATLKMVQTSNGISLILRLTIDLLIENKIEAWKLRCPGEIERIANIEN